MLRPFSVIISKLPLANRIMEFECQHNLTKNLDKTHNVDVCQMYSMNENGFKRFDIGHRFTIQGHLRQ